MLDGLFLREYFRVYVNAEEIVVFPWVHEVFIDECSWRYNA